MASKVETIVNYNRSCPQDGYQTKHKWKAQLSQISGPLDLVTVDNLGQNHEMPSGNQHAIFITDFCSKFPCAIPIAKLSSTSFATDSWTTGYYLMKFQNAY